MSRITRFVRGAAVAPLLLLTACASLQVSSYAIRGFDVRSYRTYGWGAADTHSTGDPRLDNNRFFADRVRDRVDGELAARGFEKVADGPDLLLHYHASVTQQLDLRTVDRQYGYRGDAEGGASVFDAGTLFVDIVDARTSTLVWRGWAEGSLQGAIDDQRAMEARIDDAVRRILERLPRGL